MSEDTSWFHDPAALRKRANHYDALSGSFGGETASAWLAKARALRSRADAIERATAPVDRSGEAGETPLGGSTEGESAVPEGQAPTTSRDPNHATR